MILQCKARTNRRKFKAMRTCYTNIYDCFINIYDTVSYLYLDNHPRIHIVMYDNLVECNEDKNLWYQRN